MQATSVVHPSWRTFVDAAPLPMWVEHGGMLTLANASAIRLFGASTSAELLSRWDSLRIPASDASAPAQAILRRLDGSSVTATIVAWPGEHGGRFYQAVIDEPSPLDSDWRQYCAAQDDSQFDQAEELRRGLLVSGVDCVKILDLEGHLLYMNPGGRVLMAVDDFQKVQGSRWLSFWEGDHQAAANAALCIAQQGGVGRFTGLCAKLNGQLRWWDVVVTPMPDATGAVHRILCVSRDVTEMKHSQALESFERGILESVASSKPVNETFDAICRMAKFVAGDIGECSILTVEDSREFFTVVSSPDIPRLTGLRLSQRSVMAGSMELLSPVLAWPECVAIHVSPLRGPDGVLLGVLALWLHQPEPPPGLAAKLETSVSLAAVALTREAHLRRIRYKQERLAAISRASPVGLYQSDSTGTWIYVNERHTQMTGLEMGQCDGEGWAESVHPDDRSAVLAAWREARSAGAEFKAEYRLCHNPGGHAVWVMSQETPVGADGYIGTVTDITEIKSALAAIAEGADRFQTLANNISQFCWMADPDGWIFWYNDRWYEYTGTSFEDMQGWGWRRVHHPDHMDRVVDKISRHWQTGEPWEDTFPLRDKHGAYRWFLSRAVPIRDQNGRVLRWFGTNTDVTEQRQLDAVLHRQNLALQRSNEDLSRFAFIASHDLQEPLRMILSYAQLVRRSSGDQLDEKSITRMDSIIDSAGRMSRLIRDLLTYAQASSESDDTPEPIDMNQIVAQAVELLKSVLDDSGGRVTYGALPVVHAHAPQILQVMQNLISNSIKYRRPEVAPVVEIRAERDGSQWRILIADNGQGFEPEHASRIFDFLKRLHGHDVPGSGIGLAICKTIIERNNGTIGAEGRPGQGATFWFTLPSPE